MPLDPVRVRRVIDDIAAHGRVTARADGSVHHVAPVAPSPAVCDAMAGWVERVGARRTIEVGLGYGVSALFICRALADMGVERPLHVVIDPHQATRFADIGRQVPEDAGASDCVEHLAEESQLALPRLLGEGRVFDFAFVDGNHRFEAVFVDLYFLGRLLRRGAVICLDDCQLPGVARAVNFFVQNLGWTVEERSATDPLHQWAAVRTAAGDDHRSFSDFADF